MTINDFLQKYRRVRFGYNVCRPRVRCADGYTVSVQAGAGIYSDPRADAAKYRKVELGYPSILDPELANWAEDPNTCDTVFAFVPVDLVDMICAKHGGIVGADFSNDHSGQWVDLKEE